MVKDILTMNDLIFDTAKWASITKIPDEAKIIVRGLNWNEQSPTNNQSVRAIVAVYKYREGYLVHEENLHPENIELKHVAELLKHCKPWSSVIANTYNQQGIQILKDYGIREIRPADPIKAPIKTLIKYINDQLIWITESSSNLLIECDNYTWVEDQTDKFSPHRPNPESPQVFINALLYAFEHVYRGMDHYGNTLEELIIIQERNRHDSAGLDGFAIN